VIARREDGACVFYEEGTGLCTIHRSRGQAALPLACRMFPRIVLHDPRGTFVSLSHFCPTAASLLFDDERNVEIVEAPPSLVDVGVLDGLDARHEWPPLLRPGMLMDVESYGWWESRAIAMLTCQDQDARAALGRLRSATARVISWSPGDGPLVAAVERELGSDPTTSLITAPLGRDAAAVKRWLAARLFGCWMAYQGRGLLSIVDYLERCLTLFESEYGRNGNAREAIRRADFQLLHTL
jgi:putative zinc- or iron-chelating protein